MTIQFPLPIESERDKAIADVISMLSCESPAFVCSFRDELKEQLLDEPDVPGPSFRVQSREPVPAKACNSRTGPATSIVPFLTA